MLLFPLLEIIYQNKLAIYLQMQQIHLKRKTSEKEALRAGKGFTLFISI